MATPSAGLGPKQSVDDVARAMVAGIRRPRPEMYPARVGARPRLLNAIAPGFTDRLVRKYGRRRVETDAASL